MSKAKSFTSQDPNQDQKEILKKVLCKVIDNDNASVVIIANDKNVDLCIYNGEAAKMIKSVLTIYSNSDAQIKAQIVKGMKNTKFVCSEVLNLLEKL